MLDDTTRLGAARYEDGVMRVSYTLPALAKGASIAQACANKATGPYMEEGLIIAHRFRDLKGAVMSEFQVGGLIAFDEPAQAAVSQRMSMQVR